MSCFILSPWLTKPPACLLGEAQVFVCTLKTITQTSVCGENICNVWWSLPGLFPDETQQMSRGIPHLPAWETFSRASREGKKTESTQYSSLVHRKSCRRGEQSCLGWDVIRGIVGLARHGWNMKRCQGTRELSPGDSSSGSYLAQPRTLTCPNMLLPN